MTDTLTVTSPTGATYDFGALTPEFDPGIPQPLQVAVDAWASDPSPRNWPFVTMHAPVTRGIDGQVHVATETLARAAVAAMVAACKPGATLLWQPDGQSSPVHCMVLSAIVTPGPRVRETRGLQAQGVMKFSVDLRTTPYFVGPDKTETLTVPAGTPFVAAMTATVGGDVPALTETRCTHAQVLTGLSVGLRSNPGAGFLPTQDYGGTGHTDDAAALGGECQQITTGATQATIGTPATLDAADMRGDYLALARVKCSGATVAQEFIRAQSSVVGAIGAAAVYNGTEVNPVSASSAGFDVLPLGVMHVPAGRVQAGLTSGYKPETLEVDGTGWTCASLTPVSTTLTQTFKVVHSGKLTKIGVNIGATQAGATDFRIARGGVYQTIGPLDTSATGWTYIALSTPFEVVAGETLSFVIYAAGDAQFYYSSGTSRYADGALTGMGIAATSDLAFKTYECEWQTFGATVGVQARASTGTPTARLDTVALIPTDEGAVRVTMPATTAGQGVDIDYLSEDENEHGVYIADATNVGTSLMATTEPYNPLLLRPGANTLVGMAATPIDAAPGNATVTVTYRERFLIPYTGQ